MKIITKAVLDMSTMEWIPELEESYWYEGKIEKADRAAQGAARSAAGNAADVASGDQSRAGAAENTLNPFFKNEMTAEHLFTPGQTDELLTAAGAGAGAAQGATDAALQRNAATTNNATALTKGLQDTAMDRMKAAAGASEGIAGQDVMGAKQLNQQGAAGEAGLFNTDTDAALKAMGIRTNDINTQLEAGKSGWLQNMNSTLSSLGKLGGGIGAAMNG